MNRPVIDEFIDLLLKDPHGTMQTVQLKLSATDFELRLLQADPLKEQHVEGESFPIRTGERSNGGCGW